MVAALEVPGPKTLWPGGHGFYFRRDPLTFLTRLAREYGDVVQFRAGPQRVFLLNHPDHVRDVLVTHHERFHKGRALSHQPCSRQFCAPRFPSRCASSISARGEMTSSGPHSSLKASSILVPAVFLVLRKMNLCAWETIMPLR